MRNICSYGLFVLAAITIVFCDATPAAAQYGWGLPARRTFWLSNRSARISSRYGYGGGIRYGIGWRSRRIANYYGGGGSSYGGSYGSYAGGCYGGVAISYDCCNACDVNTYAVDTCGGGADGGYIGVESEGFSSCAIGGDAFNQVAQTVQTDGDLTTDQAKPVYAYVLQTPYRELVAQRIDAGVLAPTTDNKLRLTVHVPARAKVFINGKPTTSQGSVRKYVTPAVDPNRSYVFSIRTALTTRGRTVEKTQEILVQPNAPTSLAFHFAEPQESLIAKARPLEPMEASLTPATVLKRSAISNQPTLNTVVAKIPAEAIANKQSVQKASHEATDQIVSPTVIAKTSLVVDVSDSKETLITFAVPANAQVFLGGINTQSQGADRVFQNRRLKPGERFRNYHVAVKTIENGEVVTKSLQVDLIGGKRHHFSLANDELRVAAR